ncbi:hypothetical protein NEOLI_001352 [Neolecta irregularis DAH-3]|uniref:Uncharacterized protein n=1 Tax=Neolecta irregularis (strain DAH-3) TaxID=1198029 RepID=A0A1U7LV26_NEOID|nr:hypothetical protein NEOLI_001352 [Neolecta irregularis DAH-3]|eukprot:OLL26535.1 hypothetical protein NEOLI_001352 [Neolecta irregularis DAH-3]
MYKYIALASLATLAAAATVPSMLNVNGLQLQFSQDQTVSIVGGNTNVTTVTGIVIGQPFNFSCVGGNCGLCTCHDITVATPIFTATLLSPNSITVSPLNAAATAQASAM